MTTNTTAPDPAAVRAAIGAGAWSTVVPTVPGDYWIVDSAYSEPEIAEVVGVAGDLSIYMTGDRTRYRAGEISLWGPPVVAPDGWREALAAAVPAAGRGAGE